MTGQRHERAWPFLCILACLFVLVVTWPRAWERVAPFRSPPVYGRVASDVSPTRVLPADDHRGAGDAGPKLTGILDVAGTEAAETRKAAGRSHEPETVLESGTVPQLVDPAGKLTGRLIDVDWPQLWLPEPVLPARMPAPHEAVATPPLVERRPTEGQPGETSTALRPRPMVVLSADGSLRATDILPVLDTIIAQSLPNQDDESWEGPWPEPVALFDRLEALAWECETGPWAREVGRQLRRLSSTTWDGSDPEVPLVLSRLDELTRAADSLAAQLGAGPLATSVRRAKHALARRLAVWENGVGADFAIDGGQPGFFGLLLRYIEQYEQTGSPADARLLAQTCVVLGNSPESGRQELSRRLETHYRNANVRLVLTAELLNRLMPDRQTERRNVDDVVLGRPVHGRSVTTSDVHVRLIPDPSRLRLALEISGLVSSLTSASAGPATFYNDSRATYLAQKEIELGTWGLRVEPAQVDVDNDVRLRSLRTSFDLIPLVGAVATEIAYREHQQSQPEMSREVEEKIAARARQQIDEEADARCGELNESLQLRVLQPLDELSLSPKMISAHTTERRLTMRLRLAGLDQLASHTPRPRAPADSLLSCQIHESALNNVIQRLDLDGGTFTPAEIRRRVAEIFNNPEMLDEDPGREDVEITFAESDAVSVRFQDGQVAVRLSIAKLEKSPNQWTDFQVRAYYRPRIDGRHADLVRDGIIELSASNSLRSQIPLRGVFGKTFSKRRPWKLTPELMDTDPRLADLAVTQLVVDDAWIGIAFSPQRSDTRTVVAQRSTGSGR